MDENKDEFEVEIENESSVDDIIAVPAEEEEFTPEVEFPGETPTADSVPQRDISSNAPDVKHPESPSSQA